LRILIGSDAILRSSHFDIIVSASLCCCLPACLPAATDDVSDVAEGRSADALVGREKNTQIP
jgi:hypothetical protein